MYSEMISIKIVFCSWDTNNVVNEGAASIVSNSFYQNSLEKVK